MSKPKKDAAISKPEAKQDDPVAILPPDLLARLADEGSEGQRKAPSKEK